MIKDFKKFLDTLSETNASLNYFTDFSKVRKNTAKIEIKLNQLNYLIGKTDLPKAIEEVYNENPAAFEVLGILIAVRDNNKKVLNDGGKTVFLKTYFTSLQGIIEYIEKTGLADILKNKSITNLVDYAFGIEVGLDTNARKNRGGDNMANLIAQTFIKSGITFKREVNSSEFDDIKSLGQDLKRFDFTVSTKKKTYLIETNFYNVGGSKLNEVARAYSDIAPKINKYPNYEFVWITDGKGWLSAKNKLEEAYSIIPSIYNLANIKNFIQKLKSEM
ncbi:restriction endonuclease [Treponema denticola]|uniref:type II restriction endonuclease n=1 Tax=Treponema denticola TaxID=158 RepID=UPI0020A579F6|nr:type II restriction endonuclease [Treponema denticola]UTC92958.1 restriction endonuclease [Treponema denticola]UTC95492.1 restriction endonuclease [Treponema denticola]UTC98011.1 restriction endonuclease [Treponema denticola]